MHEIHSHRFWSYRTRSGNRAARQSARVATVELADARDFRREDNLVVSSLGHLDSLRATVQEQRKRKEKRMMNVDELKRIYPNASLSFLRRNSQDNPVGLPAPNPQPTQGHALVCVAPRKSKGSTRTTQRPRKRNIIFRVYSQRPADWDGYHIKELQDCLVAAGILDDDAWDVLQGQVISCKAHSASEVRTEIETT